MNRKLSSFDVASLGLLGGVACLTAALYERLPARIPIHFGADGMANGWTSRAAGAWFNVGMGVGLWLLVRSLRAITPASWSTRLRDAPVVAMAFLVAAFMSALQVLELRAALHPGASIAAGLSAALGALWIATGQVLPRVRRNRLIGVRTFETLSSDENWLRTHRVAGHTFTAAGAGALLASLFVPHASLVVTLVLTLGSALVPTLYSYRLAQRLPPER